MAIVALFLLILIPHGLFALAGRRDVVPPLFLSGVAWLVGLRIRRAGRPAPGRVLLIANHVSWLDILALGGSARAAFVAHAGLARHGLLRWLSVQNRTVFVTRERRGTVAVQIAGIRAALARRRLAIFPEGTTGDGRALLPFKSALLAAVEAIESDDSRGAGVCVQPVALDYAEAEAIAWTGDEPGVHNLLRILARVRPVRLTIRFLPPLPHPGASGRKLLARQAREAIAEVLRR